MKRNFKFAETPAESEFGSFLGSGTLTHQTELTAPRHGFAEPGFVVWI